MKGSIKLILLIIIIIACKCFPPTQAFISELSPEHRYAAYLLAIMVYTLVSAGILIYLDNERYIRLGAHDMYKQPIVYICPFVWVILIFELIHYLTCNILRWADENL